ncbi:MAG: hypothetical protein QXU85_05200 [Sulfolobales archaeon]
MDARDALLFVLSMLGRGATATRLQKLVFLAVAEGGVDIDATFKPYYFGPWSPEVQRALNELVSEGLVEVESVGLSEEGHGFTTYRITEKGRERLASVTATVSSSQLSRLKRVVSLYGYLPLSFIVAYIYSKYPEYTELSIIKEKVGMWKKYYGLR